MSIRRDVVFEINSPPPGGISWVDMPDRFLMELAVAGDTAAQQELERRANLT